MNLKRKQACNGLTLGGAAIDGVIPRGGRARIGHRRGRRRGSVLLMVVALLSILFVVGSAFLSSVAFESRSITAAQKVQARTSVIDTLLGEVRIELAKAFVGNDGLPWNQDTASTIGNDTYGEVPGRHPLIASIEPYDADGPGPGLDWVFYGSTDLGRSLEGKTVAFDVADFPRVVVNTILEDRVDPEPDEFAERGSVYDPDDNGDPSDSKYYRRDADGDGVWDSYEYELPLSRFPAAMRGALSSQLRADDADASADQLYYALRVVSHGGMVNLSYAHQTLLDGVADPADPGPAPPYAPSGEEASLRRRFLLPPRNLPLTGLQARDGHIPYALYKVFFDGNFDNDFRNGDANARWWPIDTGANGDDPNEITSKWLPWIDPSDMATYDLRHVTTTVSYDDQLMRVGRNPGPPVSATDWVEDLFAAEATNPGTDDFGLDDWPDSDPGNPVRGRLKLSIPGLVERALRQSGDPLLQPGSSYFDEGREIDALADPGLDAAVYNRFVFTLQDAFTMMLRNVDFDDSGMLDAGDVPDRAYAAAALTANFIDFADSDDLPTQIQPVDDDLVAVGDPVFGLERQPFITEIYADNVADNPALSDYAVELYNPYSVSIDLTEYKIASDGDLSGAQGGLTGATIQAQSFLTITSRIGTPIGIVGPTFVVGTLHFDDTDTYVRLLRQPPASTDIALDQMKIAPANFAKMDTGAAGAYKETFSTSLGMAMDWFAPIPTTVDDGGVHNLGSHAGTGAGLLPVEVQFANTGVLIDSSTQPPPLNRSAFPTTGSLLLLMRYANTATQPFTFRLFADKDQVDNGRMPIFDYAAGKVANAGTAPFDLNLPWGQLVFDYFTALPLSHTFSGPTDLIPMVDQGGTRVHGRIDINSAPWPVLGGLPMVPADAIPFEFEAKIAAVAGLAVGTTTPIGNSLAQSIVAYREARQVFDGPDNTEDFSPAGIDRFRAGTTGFLTVGELANVRGRAGGSTLQSHGIDLDWADPVSGDSRDFVSAVARLVALGDWVTTRSHVFTVYGTLRGAGSKSGSDSKAIRFQETLDRLPSMFGNSLPKRIGQRVVSSYADARGD